MKLYKKILIGLACTFGTIGTCLGIFVASNTCFRGKEEIKDSSLKTWMKNIKDETKLNEIIIPGSHDAGTYKMSYLGATQHLSVKDQLDLGVRYFDLRVNKLDNDYVIFHSIINGVRFDPIIEDIANFIKTNPSETLLLDFQHFKNGSENYVYKKVNELLDGCLITHDTNQNELEFIDDLTLKDARGKCVVFFGGSNEFTQENHIFSRNNDSCSKENMALDSCYHSERNSSDSKTFIDEHLPFYVSKIQEKISKENNKGIFVLQGQLTDANLVFGPFSKERSHEENMQKYIKDLPNKDYFALINVIMRDFIDETKTSDIIKLNNIKGIFN